MSTFFHESLEYVLPGIFKAYPIQWANELIQLGKIHFTNLRVFRDDNTSGRGDLMEGVGISIRNETVCRTGYTNPIFVWCSSMETDSDVLLAYWKDRDSVIQITNSLAFIQRLKDAATSSSYMLHSLHVGPVTYDKDEGSRRNSHWVEGVFQKNYLYNPQKEFRFAFVGDCCLQDEDEIVLSLGCCKDIVRLAYTLDKNTVQEGA